MDEYYDEDYSITGDEVLDYMIYEDITEEHHGGGCFTTILIIIALTGVTLI